MVKKHQRQCVECRIWRGKPIVPKMADMPASRLRINQPPFWSRQTARKEMGHNI